MKVLVFWIRGKEIPMISRYLLILNPKILTYILRPLQKEPEDLVKILEP